MHILVYAIDFFLYMKRKHCNCALSKQALLQIFKAQSFSWEDILLLLLIIIIIVIIIIIIINFIYIASISLTVRGALQCIKTLKNLTTTYVRTKIKLKSIYKLRKSLVK